MARPRPAAIEVAKRSCLPRSWAVRPAVHAWNISSTTTATSATLAAASPEAPVGFQNSATGADLGLYAARSYSLMRPPRTGRRWIRSWERSATGWSGRGGRSCRLR